MHGDYQFANVMYRHGAPARLVAIVDWEMGTLGDPKLDLGWVMQSWAEDTNAPGAAEASYVDLTGMPSNAQLLGHYGPSRDGRSTTSTTTASLQSGSWPSSSSSASSGRDRMRSFYRSGRSCST
jgi:aminoglycoside phosphotransferase (APT) family kinase protein